MNRLEVTDDRSDRKVQVTGDGRYTIQVIREVSSQEGPFAMRFLGGNWQQLRETEQPYPLDVDVTLGDLKVEAAGTVTDPAQLKGVHLKVDVRGDNTATYSRLPESRCLEPALQPCWQSRSQRNRVATERHVRQDGR